MTDAPDIASGRLTSDADKDNFADLHPPLDRARGAGRGRPLLFLLRRAVPEGLPDLDRHPAVHPPDRRPATRIGAAETILDANILGGMCARVCPTETLCEEACVREAAEGKPVKIGLLQRYATDALMAHGQAALRARRRRPASASRSSAPGRPASPARTGSPCSAMRSTIFEARPKLGGLNEYGIAAYKTRRRLRPGARSTSSSSIGGIEVETGKALGRDFDARRAAPATTTRCSSASGSAASTRSALAGEDALAGVDDAVDFIAELRQATDLVDAAGRPARRGHRRRHDGDRRRRAVEAARRRGGDHRLPPRPGRT